MKKIDTLDLRLPSDYELLDNENGKALFFRRGELIGQWRMTHRIDAWCWPMGAVVAEMLNQDGTNILYLCDEDFRRWAEDQIPLWRKSGMLQNWPEPITNKKPSLWRRLFGTGMS